MRKLKPIEKQTIISAIDFISEKTGRKISRVEFSYNVLNSGMNCLFDFRFQDNQMNSRCTVGYLDSFIRKLTLSRDIQFQISSPFDANLKLIYNFCSIGWDFKEEVLYQMHQITPTKEFVNNFENNVSCNLSNNYNGLNSEYLLYDFRRPSKDSKRLFDLVTMIDHVMEIEKKNLDSNLVNKRLQLRSL